MIFAFYAKILKRRQTKISFEKPASNTSLGEGVMKIDTVVAKNVKRLC